ncbi:MAG: hypothetical protein WCL21_09605 [Mariniphaga sp.]
MKQRIYIETSVFGGYFDEEFEIKETPEGKQVFQWNFSAMPV